MYAWVAFGIIPPLKAGPADVAQLAEHPPCKRAVMGSIPIVGFRCEVAFGASDDLELELATAPKIEYWAVTQVAKGD